jgi:hypothetical protein
LQESFFGADRQIVEDAIARTLSPEGMMSATRHVSRQSFTGKDSFQSVQGSSRQTQGTFHDSILPRTKTNAPNFILPQLKIKEAGDVIFVMGKQKFALGRKPWGFPSDQSLLVRFNQALM